MEIAESTDGVAHTGRHEHGRPLGWAVGFDIVAIEPIDEPGAR